MIPKLAYSAALVCTLFALPAGARAAAPVSGGALPPGATPAPGEPAPPPPATPVRASATGSNGITMTVHTGAISGHSATVRGSAPARRKLAVQMLAPRGLWTTVAMARANGRGTFVAHWRASHLGVYQVRVVLARALTRAVSSASAAPVAAMTVFHGDVASYYGPGFYGNTTACGMVLTHATLGVAHRTLPCGTPIAIMYEGRSIVVPVIDRGPYVSGVDWDLTEATAKTLGMTETSPIGEVALVGHRAGPF